jgi:hypothetical protein
MSRIFTSSKGQEYNLLWLKLLAAYPDCNSEVFVAKCDQNSLTGTTEPFIAKYIIESAPFDKQKKERYETLMKLRHCNVVRYFSYGQDVTDMDQVGRVRLCSLQEYCSGKRPLTNQKASGCRHNLPSRPKTKVDFFDSGQRSSKLSFFYLKKFKIN